MVVVEAFVIPLFLLCLMIPFYLGSRIATKNFVQQKNFAIAALVGIMFNLMFYIAASTLWILLVFSASVGLPVESFFGGIAFIIVAFVMSILIMLATLMYRKWKRK